MWHLATFRCDAEFVCYRGHSGHGWTGCTARSARVRSRFKGTAKQSARRGKRHSRTQCAAIGRRSAPASAPRPTAVRSRPAVDQRVAFEAQGAPCGSAHCLRPALGNSRNSLCAQKAELLADRDVRRRFRPDHGSVVRDTGRSAKANVSMDAGRSADIFLSCSSP